MKIGDVARRAGVSTKTVRFYESLGLLTVGRLTNGYRDYDESHMTLVREIRMLAELGIRVRQTRPFLDCLVAGNSRGDDCRAVTPVLEQLAAEGHPDFRILKINSDDHPAIAARYQVLAIPTMKVFKNGELVRTIVGAKPAAKLKAELAEYLG